MRIPGRAVLVAAVGALLLANVGVRVAIAAQGPAYNGKCTLTANPFPGQPASCGCSYLSEPTDCDALPGGTAGCKLSGEECVPE